MFYFALAVLAGLAGVIQSGLTKRLGERVGLASTLHISNMFVLVGGVLILTLIATQTQGDFPKMLKTKAGDVRDWPWWLFLPGLMGLFFITVTPFSISKIGALHVFIAILMGQVVGSAIWDRVVEGVPFDRWRLIGAALTILGGGAISLSKPAT